MRKQLLEDVLMNNWLQTIKLQKRVNEQLEKYVDRQSNGVNTLNEYYILKFLADSPEKTLSQSEIIDKMPISQSATSRVLSHLLAKNCGAIERRKSQTDKRGFNLVITSIGEDIVNNLTPGVKKILSENGF